jgi:RNA polymerase-binding transcription factor DksA
MFFCADAMCLVKEVAMADIAAAKARLEAQLVELKGRQGRIVEDLATPLDPDTSEQAVETEDDVPLEGQATLVSREIASVQRALLRIENGTYGECVRCGEPIAPKRLEVRPEAALCIKCARQEQ